MALLDRKDVKANVLELKAPIPPPPGSSIGTLARWCRSVAVYNAVLTIERDDLIVQAGVANPKWQSAPFTKQLERFQSHLIQLNERQISPVVLLQQLRERAGPFVTSAIQESKYLTRPVLLRMMIDRFRLRNDLMRLHTELPEKRNIILAPFVQAVSVLATSQGARSLIWMYRKEQDPSRCDFFRTTAPYSGDTMVGVVGRLQSLVAVIIVLDSDGSTTYTMWPEVEPTLTQIKDTPESVMTVQQLLKMPFDTILPDWFSMIGIQWTPDRSFNIKVFCLGKEEAFLYSFKRREYDEKKPNETTVTFEQWQEQEGTLPPQKTTIDAVIADLQRLGPSVLFVRVLWALAFIRPQFDAIRDMSDLDHLAELRKTTPVPATITVPKKLAELVDRTDSSDLESYALRAGVMGDKINFWQQDVLLGLHWCYMRLMPFYQWNAFSSYKPNDRVLFQGERFTAITAIDRGKHPQAAAAGNGWRREVSQSKDIECFPLLIETLGGRTLVFSMPKPKGTAPSTYECLQLHLYRKNITHHETNLSERTRALIFPGLETSTRASGMRGKIEFFSADGGCQRLVVTPRQPAGTVLLNVAKRLCSALDLDEVTLSDIATGKCRKFDGSETSLRLRVPLIFRNQATFYGRAGFVYYERVNTNFDYFALLSRVPWIPVRDAISNAFKSGQESSYEQQKSLRTFLQTVNDLMMVACSSRQNCGPNLEALSTGDVLGFLSVSACTLYDELMAALFYRSDSVARSFLGAMRKWIAVPLDVDSLRADGEGALDATWYRRLPPVPVPRAPAAAAAAAAAPPVAAAAAVAAIPVAAAAAAVAALNEVVPAVDDEVASVYSEVSE